MMIHIEQPYVRPTTPALRRVMVVGSQPNQRVLETLADAGDYDVVIVESAARAYSHIKRVIPNLVVLCLDVNDPDGCHVLSMLKLDSATSWIPVVTYAMADDSTDATDDEQSGDDVLISMN